MKPLNQLVDLLLRPLAGLPPEVGLAAFAVLAALPVALVFKAASRPGRADRARERALSAVLELWLYRRDPSAGLRSVGRMLRDSLRHLAALLRPAACSLPLALLLLAQGRDWFAARAPRGGESLVLVARLDAEAGGEWYGGLELPGGRGARPPPRVASPAWREVAWRLDPAELEGHPVLRMGDVEIVKEAALAPGLARRSQVRVRHWTGLFLHPGERLLPPRLPVRRVELRLPPAEYNLLGWRTSWLRGLLAVGLPAGLLMRKALRAGF